MFELITAQSGSYEARTDGSHLEIRRRNGVVVGEGRVGLADGSFFIGDYEGDVDEEVHQAVMALLREHEADIVARWLLSRNRGAEA